MAFTSTTVRVLKLAPGIDKSPLYDDLASALAAGVSSLTSLGGAQVVARAAASLADVYRASMKLSANAVLSVAVSSTTSLLTMQIQIIPAA